MQRNLVIVLLTISTLAGCSPGLTTARRVDEPLRRGGKVAVLPFENLSEKEGASEKITDYVILSLQKQKRVEVLEFGQVYEHLRKYRVRSVSLLTEAQMDSLGIASGAEYLVVGSVLDFKETDNQYLGKVPQVSVNIRLLECRSHRTVWSGVANARGDQSEWVFGIGAVRSLEALAQGVSQKAAESIGTMFSK